MKQRISAPQSNGGARKVAPRARSASYAAWQSATRSVIAWLTWPFRSGGAKVRSGLSGVGPPPLTSSSHVPASRSTTLVPPYSRYSSAPSTFTQKSRDAAGSATTRMCVTATSGPSGPVSSATVASHLRLWGPARGLQGLLHALVDLGALPRDLAADERLEQADNAA